ncbi:tyrosine-protein phosphatase [Salinimicrobium sp. HB62]|uniref:tyrosine-protein phosphatase n=1 Tax=Salinimicrobium sp. HB62 TaxID=3077781 RepID=UPI002D77F6D6|nr:CpsB/CapC family capsule biosynthesis tyrosine phosphatase [Salinimicrobium sp. HB62]
MFNLFQKKYFLRDHLDNFIDIHNHILPGIDDGATDVETSIELVKGFQKLGISQFIATPHVMNDYYPNTRERIIEAREALITELELRGMKETKIKAAAEYMMDQAFLELVQEEELLTLMENMVLVEMSYFQPPINLNEILFKLQTAQYKPVLAHPERYAFFHSKSLNKYAELKDRGCLFQLNALSLVGHYGKNMQEIAFRLLEEGMIDFLGTDTHQLRHLDKLSTAQLFKKQIELVTPIIKRTKETFVF